MSATVAVIGAGVSGLHLARMLRREGNAVTVFEMKGEVGGRCQTVGGKARHDAGALRVHTTHTNALALLRSQGMHLDPMPAGERFVRANGSHDVLSAFEQDGLPRGLSSDLGSDTGRVWERAQVQAWQVLGSGGAAALGEGSGYDDLPCMATWEFANNHGMTRGEGFSTIREGWQTLCCRLSFGLDVCKGHHVVRLDEHADGIQLGFRDAETQPPRTFDRVVLAMPPANAMRLRGDLGSLLASRACMHAVDTHPLLRIFMHFDRPHGFQGHSFVAHGAVKQVQEISDTLLMAYCGGDVAKAWNDAQLSNRRAAEGLLMREVRLCTKLEGMPEPKETHWHYWPRAVHYWMPGVQDPEVLASMMARPLWPSHQCQLFMTGEALSVGYHAWVEGAVRAAAATHAMMHAAEHPAPLPVTHSIEADTEIAVGGVVVDYGKIDWHSMHPGGKGALDAHRGEDVTHMFVGPTAFHSKDAWNFVFRGAVKLLARVN